MSDEMKAVHKDYGSAKLGMWIFLFSEIVLFGGLFLLYSAYRAKYTADFHNGGQELNLAIAIINTVVLLTSSLTIAVSTTALQKGNRKLSLRCLALTIFFGLMFLVDKYIEWSREIGHGMYPNSPKLLSRPDGVKIFYGLYFSMTGLHGIHILAGIILLSIIFSFIRRNKITANDFTKLENAGLYWHLVDVIWIFLLPLFYIAA